MSELVTIAIPVYKHLSFLPQALRSANLQDYPNIELIVSDNGMNGSKVPEIVNKYYSKPYKFCQNSISLPVIEHFNQLVNKASGEYFVLLSDDDEISYNYVSELVSLLEQNPQTSVAIPRYEKISEFGDIIQTSDEKRLNIISGEDFIRAWCSQEYKNGSTQTHLARTKDVKTRGGFPNFIRGIHSDDALLVKLCLNSDVALGQSCTFRCRTNPSSTGASKSYQESVAACKQYLNFLDSDPTILDFACKYPYKWAELKRHLVRAGTGVHLAAWKNLDRKSLTPLEWIKAAFTLPFIPTYYAKVAYNLLKLLNVDVLVPQGLETRVKKYFS